MEPKQNEENEPRRHEVHGDWNTEKCRSGTIFNGGSVLFLYVLSVFLPSVYSVSPWFVPLVRVANADQMPDTGRHPPAAVRWYLPQ